MALTGDATAGCPHAKNRTSQAPRCRWLPRHKCRPAQHLGAALRQSPDQAGPNLSSDLAWRTVAMPLVRRAWQHLAAGGGRNRLRATREDGNRQTGSRPDVSPCSQAPLVPDPMHPDTMRNDAPQMSPLPRPPPPSTVWAARSLRALLGGEPLAGATMYPRIALAG